MEQTSEGRQERPELIQEGATIFTNRAKLLIGLVVIVAALGYLSFLAFKSATVYYYTVGELSEIGPNPDGKSVRVSGKLVPSSFSREDGSTLATFRLTDSVETLSAVYDGVLPDLFFNEHSEILVEGTYGPNGLFDAQAIIVKCPSKYQPVTDST